VVYYMDENGGVPGLGFLNDCPKNVRAKIATVLEAVRAAPPPSFSGGGMWEAMHGTMGGYHEVRVTGPPNRSHYRLFCILDNGSPEELEERGFDRPHVVVINGLVKPNASLFSDAEYGTQVRKHGTAYRNTLPRRIGS
jgi:hypothetical protein